MIFLDRLQFSIFWSTLLQLEFISVQILKIINGKIADMFRYITFDSEQIREMWKYSFEALWWLKKIGNTKFLKFVSLLYNNYIIPGHFSGDTEIVENPREKKHHFGLTLVR